MSQLSVRRWDASRAHRRTGRRFGMPSRDYQSLPVFPVARTRGVFVGRGGRGRAGFSAPAGGLPAVGFAPPGYGRVPRGTRFIPVVGGSWGPHCPWRWGASPAGAGVAAPRFRMALHAGSRGGQSLAVLPVARTRGVFVGRGGRRGAAFSAPAGGLPAVGFAPPGYGRVPRGTRFLPVVGGIRGSCRARQGGPLLLGSVRPRAAASRDCSGHRRVRLRRRCRLLC